MLPPEEAIQKISLELSRIYRQKFGKDLNSELIIVNKFGPVMAINEIFSQDEDISGASKRP